MQFSFRELFTPDTLLFSNSEHKAEFMRDVALTTFHRLTAISLILFFLSLPLLFIDYRHSVAGDWQTTPGYYLLFLTHIAMAAMGLVLRIVARLMRPSGFERSVSAYQVYNFTASLFILLWCATTSIVDQFIHTNITVYMLGILGVSTFLYHHTGSSLVLTMTSMTYFFIGLTLYQKNTDILIGHLINGFVITLLAWFFSRVFYKAYQREFSNTRTIESQKRELMRANQQLNGAYEEIHQAYNKLSGKDKEMEEDLKIAREIQDKLLHPKKKEYKGLSVNVEYLPKIAIGGDVFDISETGAGQYRIFLADAMGHGFQAALTALLIKSEYEHLFNEKLMPDKLIGRLRDEFFGKYESVTEFFTCIVIDLNLKAGVLRYASASQPVQYLIQGGKLKLLESTGMFASILAPKPYELRELPFKKNDALLLFTDGVFEELNDEKKSIGEKRLGEFLEGYYKLREKSTIGETIEYVLTEIGYHLLDSEQNDDITVIGIQRK